MGVYIFIMSYLQMYSCLYKLNSSHKPFQVKVNVRLIMHLPVTNVRLIMHLPVTTFEGERSWVTI